MITHEANSRQIALDLLHRRLSVIPVPRPDDHHDGKKAVIRWKEYQERLPTEAEIAAWFAEDQNVAVITGGISGIVVIDADSPEALYWATKHLPYTPWQTRTARGFHLWYGDSGVPVRNKARLDTGDGRIAVDVRGDGGYVIAPGSIHKTGVVYEFAGDWSVPKERLPRFWVGWIERPRRAARERPATVPAGGAAERARRYLAAIPRPEIGNGSDSATMYAACRIARGFGLSEAESIEVLWEWAGGRPGWTRDWIAKKVRNAIQYGTEPMEGLK